MKKINFNIHSILRFGLVMLVMGGSLTSCTKSDNDIFEDDAVVRYEKAKNELKNKLVDSENGWIVTFSPDANKYLGEFNLWYEFKADGQCVEKSDLALGDVGSATVSYNFVKLKTLALNFPYGAKLHEFTAMGPTDLYTDIEFIFSKYMEDGSIEFTGSMTNQRIVMRRATADEKKFNFSKKWSVYKKLEAIASCTVVISGRSTNYKWNYIGDKDTQMYWRAAQIGDRNTGYLTPTSVVNFTASEDGTKVYLKPSLTLSDGSEVSELTVNGNQFTGKSSSNATVTLK